jgi:hypothetical protein
MVERHSFWSTAYSDTYAGSQHYSNRDRDADCDGNAHIYAFPEPGAVFHADADRDLYPFAERDPHSFSNSIADRDTDAVCNSDVHRDISTNPHADTSCAVFNAWRTITHPPTDRPEPGWPGRRP